MKGKLIVVEDEKDLREALVSVLENEGAEVISASNGLEGLEKIRKENPNAVISDIQMPAMNGLELLQQVRLIGNPVPFILITGFPDHEKILAALRLGALDFIEKPFLKEKIIEAAGRALELGTALTKVESELGCGPCLKGIESRKDDRFEKMRRSALQLQIESDIYLKKKR